MTVTTQRALSAFGQDVLDGLTQSGRKTLPSRYFYDDLGSVLFEAITLLPEYGLTRADERLLRTYSPEIATYVGDISIVAELGSGTGKKTRRILEALRGRTQSLTYAPIDVSAAALAACAREIGDVAPVEIICADWLAGLRQIVAKRDGQPLLLLFLGSTVGNFERSCIADFLSQIHSLLSPGDFFLIGADLIKDQQQMVLAYDDPTGVTAAFNLNLLGRINRELGANFPLKNFAHEARWNDRERRIEMHLRSLRKQTVHLSALDLSIDFEREETIWTESSHKFTVQELDSFARASGFEPVSTWSDAEWPFAEALWRA